MPSLNVFTRSLVRNWCVGVYREADKIEPALAMEKNKKRPHAKAEYSREVKVVDNFPTSSNMAGVMGLARRGTCW